MKFFRSSDRREQHVNAPRRQGFTLIEVVVGLVLMASVLVSSLLAYSSHQRQRAFANAKREAVIIADQILQQLSVRRAGMSAGDQGLIADKPNWFWRTSLVGTTSPAGVPMRVIQFQIAKQNPDGTVTALTSVELVERI
ncbi:prepilin-type N-terminal cleavage/methylation domain-containing protein [Rubripirellula amarantea]|nr:prepilin-type N-terminal cleavage/methylation domain-containing protein [Rubripirellula amarantea]